MQELTTYEEIELVRFSYEQTDFWQTPEMVFRGITFEVADKKLMDILFFGQS